VAEPSSGVGPAEALVGGIVGAVVLTAVHQGARLVAERPPRMDRVGMRAIARGLHALGAQPPTGRTLYGLTLGGDLLSNAAYYAAAALAGRHAVGAGAALGVAAGIGALVLPRRMGLDDPPGSEALDNQLMTIAWYTLGGLAAGAAMTALARRGAGERARRGRVARIVSPSPAWRRAEAP
jgi:hypothetical protein